MTVDLLSLFQGGKRIVNATRKRRNGTLKELCFHILHELNGYYLKFLGHYGLNV